MIECRVLLGKKLIVEKITGKVINKEGWSETHVQGMGNDTSININSTVINKERVWLVGNDGKEFTWNLSNVNLGVRPDHVLSCAAPSKENIYLAGYNHNLDIFEWWDSNLETILKPSIIFPVIIISILLFASYIFLSYIEVDILNIILLILFIFTPSMIIAFSIRYIFTKLRVAVFTRKYKKSINELLKE